MDGFRRITRELEELGLTVLRARGPEADDVLLFGKQSEGVVGWLEELEAGSITVGFVTTAKDNRIPAHFSPYLYVFPGCRISGAEAWRGANEGAFDDDPDAVDKPALGGFDDPAVTMVLADYALINEGSRPNA